MFKTKEEVENYFAGSKIECLLCNKMFKAVGGQHLARMHGISVEEYKKKFGLPMGHGLLAEESRKNFRAALQKRLDDGDKSLTVLDAELMWKAQHSPKRDHPAYHLNNMRGYAKTGLKKLKAQSKERIANVDWDAFLRKMEKAGNTFSGHRGKNGIPSEFTIKRKIDVDSDFAEKYAALKKSFVLKESKKEAVLAMTKEGCFQRKIAKTLGISKTHVARIQKCNKMNGR
jgi:hypothetical protein